MSERNIKLLIEYEGTNFCGWQSQTNDKTIQDEIISAIKKVTQKTVKLTGAGRTDSQVHALGQVANFIIEHQLETGRFAEAINYYLNDEILIKSSTEVPADFDSRKSATFRRYRYLVSNEKSAIYRNLRWRLPEAINYDILRESAGLLAGEHDFSPFCVTSSLKENNNCHIYHSSWHRIGNLLVYEIRGNRFLHSMVRSLVGAMVNLALENQDKNRLNLTLGQFQDILNLKNEKRIVFTAPACGLYLVSVGYGDY